MAQDSSSNIASAVTGDTVVWDPALRADWLLDGFDGDDTIDELTSQSANYRVTHNINDGLPDEVSNLAQAGVPVLTADLYGRTVFDGDGVAREYTPLQYFSPFQSASPLYGLPRDIAPVQFDQGVLTDDGVEPVRLFTGQMTDVPVGSGRAALQAISQTRLLLSRLVQPPPVGNWAGTAYSFDPPDDILTSTWPVSWTLHRCGVYPSPPPVSGAFLHIPFHGGPYAFSQRHWDDLYEPLATSGSPEGGPSLNGRLYYDFSAPYNESEEVSAPQPHPAFSWVDGPYVAGANAWVDSAGASVLSYQVLDSVDFAAQEDADLAVGHVPFLRQTNNAGRIECYVRGDAVNWSDIPSAFYPGVSFDKWWSDLGFINSHPGASGQPIVSFAAMDSRSVVGAIKPYIYGWISASDRKLRIEYWNGSTAYRATTVQALPTDGLWHHVGVAWSVTTGSKVWATIDGQTVSTTISSTGSASMMPETLGGGELMFLNMFSLIPISELQAASGPPARPDMMPWLPQTSWTRGAYVRHGGTEIRAVMESESVEAYTFLQELAQAEATTITIDEHDVYHWRPPGWYATPAAQTVEETITTDRHAKTPDVVADYSKIRNVIRVSYAETKAVNTAATGQYIPSLAYSQVLTVPPGTSTFRIPLDNPILWGQPVGVSILSLSAVQDLVAGTVSPYSYLTWVTLNTSPDGTGTGIYLDDFTQTAPVSVYISAVRSADVEIRFVNNYGVTLYTANAQSIPELGLYPNIWIAYFLGVDSASTEVIELDAASVVVRGPRVLELNPSRVQSARMASQLARRVLGRTAWPVAVVEGIEVFGDPRRQPGDLVRVSDPDQSGFDAEMRVLEIAHTASGADYIQKMRLQEALPTGRWGDNVSAWGRMIWAASEPTGIG